MNKTQSVLFCNGTTVIGFALHNVFIGNTKYSAWYSAQGELLDAQGFNRYNNIRFVKRDGIAWRKLEEIGKIQANFVSSPVL